MAVPFRRPVKKHLSLRVSVSCPKGKMAASRPRANTLTFGTPMIARCSACGGKRYARPSRRLPMPLALGVYAPPPGPQGTPALRSRSQNYPKVGIGCLHT